MRCVLVALLALFLAAPCQGADTRPNTLTPKEIADGWILLFDGESTFGWTIDGDTKVRNGVLVVGGMGAATPSLATRFGTDFQLQFDFLNCAAVCKLKGGVYQGHARDVENPLRLAEGVSASQWHRCRIQANYRKGYLETRAEINPVRGAGHTGGRMEGFSCNPFHCAIEFEVAEGDKLSLRNIKLRPGNMKSLFDGKDLSAWKEFPDRKSKFTVTKEGWLSIKNGPGDLQTTGQWADFILQLECKTNGDNLNSGVFFRCQPDKYQQGYEAQIQNQHAK
jgi:hypothetical protein